MQSVVYYNGMYRHVCMFNAIQKVVWVIILADAQIKIPILFYIIND